MPRIIPGSESDPDGETINRRIQRVVDLAGRFERASDPLIQFCELARVLATLPGGLSPTESRERFAFSIRQSGFWHRSPKRRIKQLVYIDDYAGAPRGHYRLRPTVAEVTGAPDLVRARTSTWVAWLRYEGMPIPPAIAPATSSGNQQTRGRPGPNPILKDSIADKMLRDLQSGQVTPEALSADTLATLSATYGGSPNTAKDARKQALEQFSKFQNSNSE